MDKTPIKQKSKLCLVCGKYAKEIRKVESARIQEKGLPELLLKYGGINVLSGIMCRNCYIKLENLDKKCTSFREDCQKNAVQSVSLRSKRMSTSPASKTQIPKRPVTETNVFHKDTESRDSVLHDGTISSKEHKDPLAGNV